MIISKISVFQVDNFRLVCFQSIIDPSDDTKYESRVIPMKIRPCPISEHCLLFVDEVDNKLVEEEKDALGIVQTTQPSLNSIMNQSGKFLQLMHF